MRVMSDDDDDDDDSNDVGTEDEDTMMGTTLMLPQKMAKTTTIIITIVIIITMTTIMMPTVTMAITPHLFLVLEEDVPGSQVSVNKLLLLQVHHAPGNLGGPQVQVWLDLHLGRVVQQEVQHGTLWHVLLHLQNVALLHQHCHCFTCLAGACQVLHSVY